VRALRTLGSSGALVVLLLAAAACAGDAATPAAAPDKTGKPMASASTSTRSEAAAVAPQAPSSQPAAGAVRVVIVGLEQLAEADARKELCVGTARCPADDPEALARDGLMLQSNLFDNGFIESLVAPPEVKQAGGVKEVVYRVTEGRRFRVKGIAVKEPDAAARKQKPIRIPATTTKAGDWFSRRVMVDDRVRIERIYRDAGYANVNIDVATKIAADSPSPEVSLDVVIARGPLVTIKAVETDPPELAKDVLVLTTERGLLPGSLFNETKILEIKSLLAKNGATVAVSTNAADGRNDQVVLRFEVSR
jgi:outer membrane protein assembly factor BamA